MRRTKVIYWIFTALFGALMIFSAIPDALSTKEAVAFVTNLGYPEYFVRFIGIAKFLGVIAIVIPGFPRIKEWAYAGLFFDLVGATYSIFAAGQGNIGVIFMLVWFLSGVGSYIFYHKMLKATA